MQKQTTGAVISRLGAAMVIAECAEDEKERAFARAEAERIVKGKAGVPSKKVIVRTTERCLIGGGVIRLGPDEIPIWGTN